MNKKKINLLLDNIQNLIDTLRLELEDEEEPKPKAESNTISLRDFIQPIESELDDIEYAEEDDGGPEILLNSKEEREFYERFRLGD